MWSQQVHDLSLSLSLPFFLSLFLSFVRHHSLFRTLYLLLFFFHNLSLTLTLSLSFILYYSLPLSPYHIISYHTIKLHKILSLSPPITSSAPHHIFRLHFPLLIDCNTVCQCVSTLHTHVVPRTLILDMKSVFL